jgi:uncharacterized protein (TIGR02284 family)
MENQKTIDVLNTLIQINNDRFEGYDTAFKETEEQDLKSQFSQFMQTSQNCKQALVNEVTRLGGTPTESTKMSGKVFRVWMDVKAAITGKDRKAILGTCVYGEDVAIEIYQNALDNDLLYLRFDQQTMLNEQLAFIKADRNKVQSLHDDLLAAA